MSQESQGLRFTGCIAFDGEEAVSRVLELRIMGDTAQLMSTTWHPEVQPLTLRFGPEEKTVLAAIADALRAQERDIPRIRALAHVDEDRPVTPPSGACQRPSFSS